MWTYSTVLRRKRANDVIMAISTNPEYMPGSIDEPIVHTWAAAEDSLSAAMTFPGKSRFFSGHFPGFPVLPGVAQLFMIRRFARRAFPDFPEAAIYRRIKFRRLVCPDERVVLEMSRKKGGAFAFTMSVDGEVASCGSVEPRDAGDPVIAPEADGAFSIPADDGSALPRSVLLDLLPHRPPMIVLADVLESDVSGVAYAIADTSASSLFFDPEIGGVPACAAFEFMAQTMALAVGAENCRLQRAPKVGLLLGTRRLDVCVDSFGCADRYVVAAKCTDAMDDFASFNCMIVSPEGETVAAASLTAFQPPGDPKDFAEKFRNFDKR